MIKVTFFLQGTNSTGGEVDVVPRICAKPEVLSYTIKEMQVVRVSFNSNPIKESSGAVAGYASYNEGVFFFTFKYNVFIEHIFVSLFIMVSGCNYLIIVIDQNQKHTT